MTTVQPYTIDVPDAALDDLRERLANTRWPDEIEDAGWEYGTNLAYLRDLVTYWHDTYDWRAEEARLNTFPHFTTTVDGEELRFVHVRGVGPNPVPILLYHGWPDSWLRYEKLIPLLADPAAHGGDAADAFDVIVPTSLIDPGTDAPHEQDVRYEAERCWKLVTEVLGYERFVVGGGDTGSALAQVTAVEHPASIIGMHLIDIGWHVDAANFENLSPAEQQFQEESAIEGYQEGAYAMVQGQKPQMLAFGLNDSPAGWAAWAIEKYHTWSDCDGDLERVYSKDELLTHLMLRWLAGIDPRGYREEFTSPSLAPDQQVHVPTGLALPPKDIGPIPPRELTERNLRNIIHWRVLPHGGHFLPMEDPALMADDLRTFVRMLERG